MLLESVTAVCIYRLVMISIDLSETTKKMHWKSEIKFQSRTGFCLGLHTAVVFRMQSFNVVSYPEYQDTTKENL